MEPHEGAEGLWSGCPMHYRHPLHDGYPTHHAGYTTSTPRTLRPSNGPRPPPAPHLHQTPRGSHALWTPLCGHLTSHGRPTLCSHLHAPPVPPSVAPPARGCGPGVGALWAAAPHVARAGSRIRLALTCRCVVMETGKMLMSPWQREPGNFGGDGEQSDGVGGDGFHTPLAPPPHRGRAQPRPLSLQPKGFLGAQFAPAPINLSR